MKQLGINEVFLPIDGFHNYEVSNYGNFRNIKFDRVSRQKKAKESFGELIIVKYK